MGLFKRKKKASNTFTKWLDKNWDKDNMFPPELESQEAIYILVDYLLGEDYYFVNPLNTKQGNVEIVNDILYKYSKEYRDEYKERHKNGLI